MQKRVYNKSEGGKKVIDVDFNDTLETLKENYLNVYEGVRSEVLYTTKFYENSDLGTTYLGKVNMRMSDKIKAEENFQYQSRAIQ